MKKKTKREMKRFAFCFGACLVAVVVGHVLLYFFDFNGHAALNLGWFIGILTMGAIYEWA